MSVTFFKDKSFGEASQPNINPKNNVNDILQDNSKKPKENFEVGSQADINPFQESCTIFKR